MAVAGGTAAVSTAATATAAAGARAFRLHTHAFYLGESLWYWP